VREHQKISDLAYELWQARGCPDGSPEADWQEAEKQLAEANAGAPSRSTGEIDETLAATFPASDPSASHRPDEPPSNADEKWAAARRGRTKR
jgi:hypothetical protein